MIERHIVLFGYAHFEFESRARADAAEIWKKTVNLPLHEFQKAFPDAKLVDGTLGSAARPPY